MSFYRPQNVFLDRSFCICPLKSAFFVAKIDFDFIFSEIKNSYAEKSAVFAEFHKFLSSPPIFFWVIFLNI